MSKNLQQLHPMSSFGVVSAAFPAIRVNRLEDRKTPLIPFPHKHDFYQLLFVTKGAGIHEIDFKKHKVSPGRAFFMKPSQVHSWSLNSSVKGFVCEFKLESIFTDKAARRLYQGLLKRIPDTLTLPAQLQSEIIPRLNKMLANFENQSRHADAYIASNLSLILIDIERLQKEPIRTSKETSDLEKFLELVEVHFKNEHEVDFYAEQMGLSAKALSMRLTRHGAQSAQKLIIERCLLEARRLLAYSDLSVSEIAYTLGFDDPNYFARLFKSKIRKAPKEFRESSRPF